MAVPAICTRDWMEVFNDCIEAVIGLKVQDPVPVHPMTVRMIFFYPHTGTSKHCTAEDAGIMMPCDGKSTTPTGNTLTCDTILHICSAYQGNKTVLHASYNRACGQGLQVLKMCACLIWHLKDIFHHKILESIFFCRQLILERSKKSDIWK